MTQSARSNVGRGVLARLVHKPLALVSLGIVFVIVVACAGAPLFAPYDPIATDFGTSLSGPTAGHILGTDSLGRDILSRLLYGGQVTLLSTAIAALVAVVLGVLLGLVAGYVGGRTEAGIMRVVDALQAIPSMVILLVMLAIFANNLLIAMMTLGVLLSTPVARVVRSAALTVRNELYVDAARVGGLGRWQIIWRHILPRVLGPVIVQGSLLFAVAVIVTGSIGFLGLGVHPPNPSWGSMISDSAPLIQQAPWQLVPVGGIMTILVLALGLFGDILRDVIAERWAGTPVRTSKKSVRAVRTASTDTPALRTGDASSEPNPDALLSVRDLRIAFDGNSGPVQVVHGVGFDVFGGEILGIVGESGSGKTVTARSIIGLLRGSGRVTSGDIRLSGRSLTGLSDAQLARYRGAQIGFVPQEPIASLDPTFRVGHQIAEAARKHHRCSRAEARRRAIELLERVRIPEPEQVARLYPHQVSGGMAQRISIARALSGQPSLLIADEPTSALDVTVQAEILALLATLRDELGMAVMLITHDLGVIRSVCQRVLVMYAGEIVEQAPVAELLAAPRHPYSRGLILADPRHARAGGPLPSIPGTVPKPTELPVGCHFQARCPLATEECAAGPIPLLHLGDGRDSRCIHVARMDERATSQEVSV